MEGKDEILKGHGAIPTSFWDQNPYTRTVEGGARSQGKSSTEP